jgi:hypothetical protein
MENMEVTFKNLDNLYQARKEIDKPEDFLNIFVGVLSCYTPADTWREAMESAVKQYTRG